MQRTDSTFQWLKLLLGLAVVFALFQWSAGALGSGRGEAGLFIAVLVVSVTVLIECVLFGRTAWDAMRTLGLGRPRFIGLAAAAVTGLLLLSVVLFFVQATEASFTFFPGWILLLPGLFAQGGVAEETLFRGYLFGRIRRGRAFWRAATLAMLPFVAAHLYLFVTITWPIALASIALAVVTSFPLAHLFELGGNTIWAPAVLHFVIQGTVKVVIVSSGETVPFPVIWMVASAVLPFLVFLVPRSETTRSARS